METESVAEFLSPEVLRQMEDNFKVQKNTTTARKEKKKVSLVDHFYNAMLFRGVEDTLVVPGAIPSSVLEESHSS